MTDASAGSEPRARARPVLSASAVVRTFGASVALDGVDLELHAGEVVGLVGANGAGKSTLVAILSGALAPTSGTVSIDGSPVRLSGPEDAAAAGIATVQQDVDAALAPDLSVAENLVLDRITRGELGFLPSRRTIERAARELVGDGFTLPLRTPVSRLRTAQKQQLLIARALGRGARVLFLDEPTAALSITEQRALHDQVRRLAAEGTAVVYITHHLGELTAVSDRVVALRDGRIVGRFAAPLDPAPIAAAILGSLAGPVRRPPRTGTAGESVLRARGVVPLLGRPGFDLELRRGEVVGITGLLGSGKTELLRQLVGADALLAGTLELDGRAFRPRHPSDAIAAGIGFVPEDRRSGAEFPDWDLAQNASLADLRRHSRFGLLDRRSELRGARELIEALRIKAPGPSAPLSSLSGGNRQKVVVARWLAARSRVLVLDEPFRGVDLAARADLARLVRSDTVESALVASSDPEEILEVADRVLILSDGRLVAEVRPDEVDEESLARLMVAGLDAPAGRTA